MRKYLVLILAVLFLLSCLIWLGVSIVKSVNLDHGMTSYLKLAANANTVEMAKPQLGKAIAYLEKNNMTEGVVSIFFKNPKNDVGFFYQNLKASLAKLEKIPLNATQLEESNVLIKLRESLLENDGNVTRPSGLEIYPYNALYFWWAILSIVLVLVFGFWFYIESGY